MRVLALDDDKAVLKAVKTILTLSGHEVDYKMDGHDGVWFLENVTLGSSTKAILMTGYGNRNLVNTVFGRGASGYLMKPFTADELLKHIEFHGATLTADVLPPDKMAEKTAISAGDT